MNERKNRKPHGIKHKVREEREREKRIAVALTVAVLTAIIAISGFAIYSTLNPGQTISTGQPKAAIVDQGSLSPAGGPNPYFIENVTNILKQAGYTVDYYPGEKVTVESYRNLPTHNYELIILRVHSALRKGAEPPVALFTSESYSQNRYVYEQLAEKLTIVHYDVGGEEQLYFGIVPNFVKSSLNGRFQNSIIIMMGCNGLTYTDMANAFVEKGVKLYISWDGPVSISHTDEATANLLKHLITENQTAANAVAATMQEIGPDPTYQAKLLSYPTSAGMHNAMNMEHCISHETQIITNQCTSRKCPTNSIDSPILCIALPDITCNYRISRLVAIPTERSSTTACAFNPRAKTMSFRQEVQLKNTA